MSLYLLTLSTLQLLNPAQLLTTWTRFPVTPTLLPNTTLPSETKQFLTDHRIQLSLPDREGRRSVVHLDENNSSLPICEDRFTDLEATVLCGLVGESWGRRTRKTTKKPFYGTKLSCFNPSSNFRTAWFEGVKVIDTEANCSLELYSEESLPCAATQAVAVHCWTTERAIDLAIDSIRTTRSKWNIVFKMFDFKMGRWFNLFDKALGVFEVISSDFTATHCGETPPKFSVKLNSKTKQYMLSGGFVKGCRSCVVMMFLSSYHLYPNYICPDDPYALNAEYRESLHDADIEYIVG